VFSHFLYLQLASNILEGFKAKESSPVVYVSGEEVSYDRHSFIGLHDFLNPYGLIRSL